MTMKEKMEQLTEPLDLKKDIEIRFDRPVVGSGFFCLAYKTARTDVNRLNKVFGSKWYPEYYYDEKGNLCCKINVWDDEIKQWIARVGVGSESAVEKVKGNYSDAMKRAGFNWGIGIELYSFPQIYVNWPNWEERNGKKHPTCEYDIKDWWFVKEGVQLVIKDKSNKTIWAEGVYINNGADNKKPPQKKPPASKNKSKFSDIQELRVKIEQGVKLNKLSDDAKKELFDQHLDRSLDTCTDIEAMTGLLNFLRQIYKEVNNA